MNCTYIFRFSAQMIIFPRFLDTGRRLQANTYKHTVQKDKIIFEQYVVVLKLVLSAAFTILTKYLDI